MDKVFLLFRDNHIFEIERQSALERHFVPQVFNIVQVLGSTCHSAGFNYFSDNFAERFFREQLVDVSNFFWDVLVCDYTANTGLVHFAYGISVFINIIDQNVYQCVNIHFAFVVCDNGFFFAVESHAFAPCSRTYFCNVIQSQHHVLRRNGNRCTVGGIKDVVRSQHQDLRLQNSFVAKRQVNGHLVAIEVGVECRTC
ncbi:hypothetical protein SDC9_129919 [bioreactor metagenome]|uniref:Uncharacterized protein n=1 Tax=bioreactor metagenome TaxID=1076179 RepID=A0A645D0Z4_9ZZZZ